MNQGVIIDVLIYYAVTNRQMYKKVHEKTNRETSYLQDVYKIITPPPSKKI